MKGIINNGALIRLPHVNDGFPEWMLEMACSAMIKSLNEQIIKQMNNTCTCCFTDYIVKCSESIRVNAKLEAETDYMWVITDKFNRQYHGTFTTNSNGAFDIPVAELPAGLLTEYSGNFKLEVFDNAEACTPVKFLIAQEVDCIVFDIHAGTRVKDFLGCEFPG